MNAAPPSVGREKIRATLASTYVDGSNRGFTMTPSEITVKGDWAIARTDNSGETKTADGWQQIDTKSFFLLSRTDQDGWKIYRYMWNPNQP